MPWRLDKVSLALLILRLCQKGELLSEYASWVRHRDFGSRLVEDPWNKTLLKTFRTISLRAHPDKWNDITTGHPELRELPSAAQKVLSDAHDRLMAQESANGREGPFPLPMLPQDRLWFCTERSVAQGMEGLRSLRVCGEGRPALGRG